MTRLRKYLRGRDSRKQKGAACAVCQAHPLICVTHHAPELQDLERFYVALRHLGIKRALPYASVRLCPNHHSYLHLSLKGIRGLDNQEWQKTREVALMHKREESMLVTVAVCATTQHFMFKHLREMVEYEYDPWYAQRELKAWGEGKPKVLW